ncbi:exodeoxyribonuclease VII large subunit [Methylocella sp.]|uniref:exodeoxyribonuclease VII large subunit n=1 Tax=Methylocella sp. TaxID=1978226 RepID=UPI003783FC0B
MTDASGSETARSNAPEFSVSELSGALKRAIEDRFGFVRLRGEISNYRGPHSSGHAYFSLKDASARIDAVVWKGTFARLKVKPQEGLEVVASGKITTFPGKSSYQIVVEAIEPAGVGALMALLEERRRRLAAEGLFDAARKRPLPFLPRVVGVVTSPTGAVIRDILHRLADRFPRHVLVWPVRVQGETSAAEVAAAISGFSALPPDGPIPRPDVVIVARGGGSLEDLWGFNEEIVARAAAASAIPIIAAVGHETDWTLIDHAADHRAPTPTGAAEKAVPVRLELAADLAALSRRHAAAMRRLVEQRRGDLRGTAARALPAPDEIMAARAPELDHAGRRVAGAIAREQDRRRLMVERAAQRLARQSPQARLAGFSNGSTISAAACASRASRGAKNVSAFTALAARLGAARAANFAPRAGAPPRDAPRSTRSRGACGTRPPTRSPRAAPICGGSNSFKQASAMKTFWRVVFALILERRREARPARRRSRGRRRADAAFFRRRSPRRGGRRARTHRRARPGAETARRAASQARTGLAVLAHFQ